MLHFEFDESFSYLTLRLVFSLLQQLLFGGRTIKMSVEMRPNNTSRLDVSFDPSPKDTSALEKIIADLGGRKIDPVTGV